MYALHSILHYQTNLSKSKSNQIFKTVIFEFKSEYMFKFLFIVM